MLSTVGWMVALTMSVCAIVVTAGANQPLLHLIACGAIALLITFNAIRENRNLITSGASKNEIGGSTARNAGLVWAWGALSILVTYQLVLQERWPEWWHFFLGFALAALGSLLFANTLARDEANGRVDYSVVNIGRTLVIVQAVGVAAGLISMFVDEKFPRDPKHADWAGCNIFFFGGLAIIAISLNALRSSR